MNDFPIKPSQPRSLWSNVVEGVSTTVPTNTQTIAVPIAGQYFYVIEEEK